LDLEDWQEKSIEAGYKVRDFALDSSAELRK
jgi:hypothetical protein